MEEILASIRRIIADEEPAAEPAAASPAVPARPALVTPKSPAAATPLRPVPAPEPPSPQQTDALAVPSAPEVAEPDVLDLTEAMTASDMEGFRTIDGKSDQEFDDLTADEPSSGPQSTHADLWSSKPQPPERPLISSSTSAAVDSAFNSLAHTVLIQNARTLEDLVREMLRPMLKTWLDDNLPGLVERLVRAEIDRVSRGRG